MVGIPEAGQFFGEGCMDRAPLRISTTTAMEVSVVTAITKKAMWGLLNREPRFSELFVTFLLKRNGRIEDDLIDQLFNSSEKRLARLLFLLANFGKEGTPETVMRISVRKRWRNDRHHPVAGQLFHEQVPQARSDQLQREKSRSIVRCSVLCCMTSPS